MNIPDDISDLSEEPKKGEAAVNEGEVLKGV